MSETAVKADLDAGLQHHRAGRLQEAQAHYRKVLALEPDNPVALNLLGVLAQQSGQPEQGVELIRKALTLVPNAYALHNNLGVALADLGRLDEAAAAYQKSIQVKGNHAEAWHNLGSIRMAQQKWDEAADCFKQAIKNKPNYADALGGLGMVYVRLGRPGDALTVCSQAVDAEPNNARAHLRKATVLLILGDYAQAWREFEARFRVKDPRHAARQWDKPRWDGLARNKVLVWAEAGSASDFFQMARYLNVVAGTAAEVIVECPEDCVPIVARMTGVRRAVAQGHDLGAFDAQIALLSLPGLLGTTTKNVPSEMPYLSAEPTRQMVWQPRVRQGGMAGERQVGLAWRFNAAIDAHRGVPVTQLGPLAAVKNVRFHHLHTRFDPPPDGPLPPGLRIVDHVQGIADLEDLLALIANLDAVVTVDTLVAHLAGALGKPTCVLVPATAEWRWGRKGTSTPWYPSVHVCRAVDGKWEPAVREAAAGLAG